MTMVKVLLDDREWDALIALSRAERRDPRGQAALIVQRELERRGLLAQPDGAPLYGIWIARDKKPEWLTVTDGHVFATAHKGHALAQLATARLWHWMGGEVELLKLAQIGPEGEPEFIDA